MHRGRDSVPDVILLAGEFRAEAKEGTCNKSAMTLAS